MRTGSDLLCISSDIIIYAIYMLYAYSTQYAPYILVYCYVKMQVRDEFIYIENNKKFLQKWLRCRDGTKRTETRG